MPTGRQNDVILASRYRRIYFYNVTFAFQSLICDFSKKNVCQYLYFKMLLYISQNADMSAK